MRFIFVILLSCIALVATSQSNDLIYVKLDSWGKDQKFDKLQLITAFYYVQNDSIKSNDFENMREAQLWHIVKPKGYKNYAYGYLSFNSDLAQNTQGTVPLLMVNIAERDPKLFIDKNCNKDFTDDDAPLPLPYAFNTKDTLLVKLCRGDNPNACKAIQLSRMDYSNTKYAYKNLLNEYYEIYAQDRKFVGIDYCLREQHYTIKQGIIRTANDSFRIALFDGNNNGKYTDPETDRYITANLNDSSFEAMDEMRSSAFTKDAMQWIFEKNGDAFEIVHADEAGSYMTVKTTKAIDTLDRLPKGKKVPNFSYIDWQGKTGKLRKLRKYQVYIYYIGPYAKNFTADTAILRTIADKYQDKVRVIGFIDVNKSYELNIFGTYSYLNWTAAYKNKYTNQLLKLKGIPSSVWLGKRRKLKQYNITPAQLLEALQKENL